MEETRSLSSARAKLRGTGSGAEEGLGTAPLLQEWQCKVTPLLQNGFAGTYEVHWGEDAHSAGMPEKG